MQNILDCTAWKYRMYLGINRKSKKYLINYKIILSKEWGYYLMKKILFIFIGSRYRISQFQDDTVRKSNGRHCC